MMTVMLLWMMDNRKYFSGMRFHKLKLLFGSPLTDCRRQAAQEEVTEVVIDSVCGMKVLDWWSPQYLSGGEGIRIKHNIDHFGV